MLESGMFENVEINTENKTVRLGFADATQHTRTARLCIEQPAKIEGVGVFRPSGNFVKERGAYIVSLKTGTTRVELRNSR